MANLYEIELRIAQQRRRREEKKQVRRQQAVRQASVETVVATPSAATSFAAGESPGSQPWHQHVPADDALANSPNLPFPLADSLPAYNLAAASSSPASADEQPETGSAATSITTGPFPSEETSVAVAQGETLAPAGSALEENPKLLSPGVSDSSGDVAQQQQVLPRRSAQTSMHQTRREHAAPAATTTTTTTTTRVRAVMLHWGRLWRHPRQLYRHWLGRPLFRRVERADDEAVQQV